MESGDCGQHLALVSPIVASVEFKVGLVFAITLNHHIQDLLVQGQMLMPEFAKEYFARI